MPGTAPPVTFIEYSRRERSIPLINLSYLHSHCAMPHVIQDASHRGEASLQEQKPPSHIAGLRTVALFEALKGVLAVLLGYGLFSLAHKDVGEFAEHLIRHLHLNPDRHISQAFIHAADRVTEGKILALAFGALAYSAVRFVEAYGLWNTR